MLLKVPLSDEKLSKICNTHAPSAAPVKVENACSGVNVPVNGAAPAVIAVPEVAKVVFV